ncbi:hypothetical protein SELMODRAFT_84463 [Selaginella moellendorffii]|uniref:Amino acid transporter transmembrane domain-containing protein n=1 Tax=Selaginella moellendorffii TaxID=88036 RepID=D8R2W1_SELML|nr:hypothetical protein SELMODRAFT_84463 [Selaginella moellendorffii]
MQITNVEESNNFTAGRSIQEKITGAFLVGGSSFDAWLTTTTAQVAQVLLTLPHTLAQMGITSGIVFQLLYGALGCWSCYITMCLYMDYVAILERHNARRKNHIIQWYEVLDGHLGRWWRASGLLFNCALMVSSATIQLIACANTIWYMNNSLDKRTWTFIFGALCFLTVLIPTARNYRLWVFIGIFMTTYTAWYFTIASIFFEKHDKHVQHSAPVSKIQYFTGATNNIYTFGNHALTLEIVEAMDKPRKYKITNVYAILYIFTLTLPSAVSVYWRFGDQMLNYPNALAVLSPSKFRNVAIILMLTHQFIEFSAFVVPVFAMWEKLLGIHCSQNYTLKCIARMPIVLGICFLAIMLPFFGSINSVVGAIISSIGVYILPCLAFMVIRRHKESRENAIEQPPFWIKSWVGVYCINLGLVLWVGIIGAGFGSWASMHNIMHKVEKFGLFAKCFQC